MHHLPALGQTLGMLPPVMLFLIILQASQRDQIVTEQLHPLPKPFCDGNIWEAERHTNCPELPVSPLPATGYF